MDARTLEALKASIAKWERNAAAENPSDYLTKPEDCPLCTLFFNKHCKGCPVSAKVNDTGCWGTPYVEAAEHWYDWSVESGNAELAHSSAREEVAFLKSLLPVEEQ